MNAIRLGMFAVLMGIALVGYAQSPGVNHPAVDGLGRALPAYEDVGDLRTNKVVAMFYWTWHYSQAQTSKNYDLSKIITDPAMVNDYNHPNWASYLDTDSFFWGEPIFGFYDSKDKWVIRKQLEMLGAAGVDVLFYDATNWNNTWKEGYEAVGEVMAEMRSDGVPVPQFAFMLNFWPLESTAQSLVQLYDELYSIGKYQDSWFMWEGKPVVMAYPEVLDNSYPGDTAGMKFTAASSFSGIDATCPSWNNNIGDLTLSLYTWNTDYATSVAQTPLASQTFVDFNDNAFLNLEFDSLPAGDYVWVLTNPREVVGVWKYQDETLGVVSYFNGSAVSGDYASQIKYVSNGYYSYLTSGGSWDPVHLAEGLDPATLAAIKDFFTFRPGQPDYKNGPASTRNDQWGWLENYPQHGYVEKSPGEYELMTVGVAQNWSEQTHAISAMNGSKIHGRSYTAANGFSQLTANSHLHGYNFQEQWNRALLVDPDIIFITGWNEWVAGRYEEWGSVSNAFPDTFSAEYSRDIEPMKGGHGDNYYYQMIANIRKFKGMEPPEKASSEKAITIDGAFGDWADVTPHFKASKGNVKLRDGYGYLDSTTGLPLHYINNTARNDIIGAKVARDGFNVYFHVAAATNLTACTDPNWMQLLIDIDRNKATGWEGYDFMIDHYAANGKAMLSTSSGGWNWTDLAEVAYSTSGAEMEIAIPRVLLDLPTGQPLDIEFKWLDNYSQSGDIMDVYTDGEAAPSGRFSFHYTETPLVIFTDSFAVDVDVWNDLNTELFARQAGGITNSTYTLGLNSGQTYVSDSHAGFTDPVLVRVNTSGGGGGHVALDLDTDFGGLLNGATWTLSYTARLDANTGFTGWTGFSVGNPADTPSGAGTGFGFNMRSNGTYQVWTNGTLVAEVARNYSVQGVEYTLATCFNEAAGTAQLTYSDSMVGDTDLGTFPTAFAGGSRFVELRNHVDTSTDDGVVDMRYDDLAISVLASQSLYPAWAQEHGLSTTNALLFVDTDGDGLCNLAEYALGTDPNLADAQTVKPTIGFTADFGTYVYNRRSDAATRGLEYGLASKTNLLDPDWIYVGGLWETGTNAIDPAFNSITNEIPTTGLDHAFFQLEINAN